jgi:hypothetical protein
MRKMFDVEGGSTHLFSPFLMSKQVLINTKLDCIGDLNFPALVGGDNEGLLKLVQHRLRWFGHIQRRPPEAPVRSGILSRPENTRRGRGSNKKMGGSNKKIIIVLVIIIIIIIIQCGVSLRGLHPNEH